VQLSIPPAAVIRQRTTVDEAVASYLPFISSENAALHIANKVSNFRRFIDADRVEKNGGPIKTKRRRLKKWADDPRPAAVFHRRPLR
jgi:hypothetical protein